MFIHRYAREKKKQNKTATTTVWIYSSLYYDKLPIKSVVSKKEKPKN